MCVECCVHAIRTCSIFHTYTQDSWTPWDPVHPSSRLTLSYDKVGVEFSRQFDPLPTISEIMHRIMNRIRYCTDVYVTLIEFFTR